MEFDTAGIDVKRTREVILNSKQELENAILSLLQDFEEKVGWPIKYVESRRSRGFAISAKITSVSVSLDNFESGGVDID
jgi:hypothetical protein